MKLRLPTPDQALPGHDTPMPVPDKHFVNGNRIAVEVTELLPRSPELR